MILCDTLVIGAGLSGLYFSHLSQDSKEKIIILEKSRGVGGRLATRRIDGLPVDHGIQWFQLPLFTEGLLSNSNGFYSQGGMTTLAKSLAKNLTIHFEKRASRLKYENNYWITETVDGEKYQSTRIVLTAPLPQALELLNEEIMLSSIYSKTIEGLFILNEVPTSLKSFEKDQHQFTFMKDKDLHPQALVIALSDDLSGEYFDEGDEFCLSYMKALFHHTFPELKYNHLELKRWRYARPQTTLPLPFLEFKKDLYLIGDGFLEGNAPGAIESARSLHKMLSQI